MSDDVVYSSRVHGLYAEYSPVARTISGLVAITPAPEVKETDGWMYAGRLCLHPHSPTVNGGR